MFLPDRLASHTYNSSHSLLRHSDTDQILLSFRGVEEYLKLEETNQYVAANAQLITQLELMADMEQPSLGNIL